MCSPFPIRPSAVPPPITRSYRPARRPFIPAYHLLLDPCALGPCIDPMLGPTAVPTYSIGTTLANGPVSAWIVNLNNFIAWGLKRTLNSCAP